jgi:hypothetical protein
MAARKLAPRTAITRFPLLKGNQDGAVEYFKDFAFSSTLSDRVPPEKCEEVFKKHALSLAEGARPVLP